MELFLVETILCAKGRKREQKSRHSSVYNLRYSLQKLLRIRAAFSLSRSKDVGQKASEPSLCDSWLTGPPNLSAYPHSLSKELFVCAVVFFHRDFSDMVHSSKESRLGRSGGENRSYKDSENCCKGFERLWESPVSLPAGLSGLLARSKAMRGEFAANDGVTSETS